MPWASEFDIVIDDRDRMRAKDMVNTAMFSAVEDRGEDKEISIRAFLQEQGVRGFPAVGTYCTNWKFLGEHHRETPGGCIQPHSFPGGFTDL